MTLLEDFKKKVSKKDPLCILESKLALCVSNLDACRQRYAEIKKQLDAVETDLINAKEEKRRAEEELETYRQTYVLDSSVDDATNAEVAQYRTVMEKCLEKIAHEPPLRYMMISDLENAPNT
jgi:uncharacterized coiled-coil DUF342 family protein